MLFLLQYFEGKKNIIRFSLSHRFCFRANRLLEWEQEKKKEMTRGICGQIVLSEWNGYADNAVTIRLKKKTSA